MGCTKVVVEGWGWSGNGWTDNMDEDNLFSCLGGSMSRRMTRANLTMRFPHVIRRTKK